MGFFVREGSELKYYSPKHIERFESFNISVPSVIAKIKTDGGELANEYLREETVKEMWEELDTRLRAQFISQAQSIFGKHEGTR